MQHISKLKPTMRLYKHLVALRIITLEDLVQYSASELQKEGLDAGCINEIRGKLSECKIKLRGD
jgi:hypothetical protein